MSSDANNEIPTSSVKRGSHGYDRPSQHQKCSLTESHDNNKQSEEKMNKKKHEYNKPKTMENGADNSRIYQRLSTTGKASASSKGRTGGYDIPKDTINEAVIRNSEPCQPSPSCSPTKQPLLPIDRSRSTTPRSPPPTILLSPPDDPSSEKAKVIFEYDREKGRMKLVDDQQMPNFLVRNKKPILISAFVLLIFLLFSVSIVIIYASNSQPS